jgi:hypothetical protein
VGAQTARDVLSVGGSMWRPTAPARGHEAMVSGRRVLPCVRNGHATRHYLSFSFVEVVLGWTPPATADRNKHQQAVSLFLSWTAKNTPADARNVSRSYCRGGGGKNKRRTCLMKNVLEDMHNLHTYKFAAKKIEFCAKAKWSVGSFTLWRGLHPQDSIRG